MNFLIFFQLLFNQKNDPICVHSECKSLCIVSNGVKVIHIKIQINFFTLYITRKYKAPYENSWLKITVVVL